MRRPIPGPVICASERVEKLSDITSEWKILAMRGRDSGRNQAEIWIYFGEIARDFDAQAAALLGMRRLHSNAPQPKFSGVTGKQLTPEGVKTCLYVRMWPR